MSTKATVRGGTSSRKAVAAAPAPRRPRPTARFRIRVMSADAIAVGPGKIALLEAIRETRSISAAARSIAMSYRRAWILVDELNAALKHPAVRSAQGGEHGGGSELTPTGAALVDAYRRVEACASQACATEIDRLLKLVR
jgi:molybdate transport system regulatory protein